MNNYQYIKDALDSQNKSISWLASEIGVSKGYLSRLINNKINEPGNTKIMAIHQALGLQNNLESYEKSAYIVNVNTISIEKYIYVAQHNIDFASDIYIVVEEKTKLKEVQNSLNRFYDYLNFSATKILIVSQVQLKKTLKKEKYTLLYTFNNEAYDLEEENIENIDLEENDYLQISKLKNYSILFLSNNQSMLSILLNVLKLSTNYAIDDYAIYKDVNTKSNIFIANQVHILEQISKQCQNNRIYLVGNELIYFSDDTSLSDLKNSLINVMAYLAMFDVIINIDFCNEQRSLKNESNKNEMVLKSFKKKVINLDASNDIKALAMQINKTVEDYINEN